MVTAKQRKAAMENIKKAQAARRKSTREAGADELQTW